MIILPWWRCRETYLMPEAKRSVAKMNSTDCLLGDETTHNKTSHNLSKLLDGTPEHSSAKIDHLRGALYKALDAVTGPFTNSTVQANP